jgi:hypothetical protein
MSTPKELLPVDLGVLHVADAVGVGEHRSEGLVVVLLAFADEHRVAEIGKSPKPRVSGPRDDVDDEEGVLGLGVVVL